MSNCQSAFEANFANLTINEDFLHRAACSATRLSDKKCTSVIKLCIIGWAESGSAKSFHSFCSSARESTETQNDVKDLSFSNHLKSPLEILHSSQKTPFLWKDLGGHHCWPTVSVDWRKNFKRTKNQKYRVFWQKKLGKFALKTTLFWVEDFRTGMTVVIL